MTDSDTPSPPAADGAGVADAPVPRPVAQRLGRALPPPAGPAPHTELPMPASAPAPDLPMLPSVPAAEGPMPASAPAPVAVADPPAEPASEPPAQPAAPAEAASAPSTGRSKPRRHLVRTHPWRTAGVLVVVVAVLMLVPMLVLAAAHTIGNSTEGTLDTGSGSTDPGQPGVSKAVLPDTPGALVTMLDETGAAAGLAVFALSPSGSGGTVVVVPTGTEVIGADGSSRLGDAFAAGEEAQLAAVEGFLGVTLGRSEVVDEAGLTQLLEPLAPFAVDLPFDVEADGPDGPTVVLPAGTQTLSAEQAAAVLTARTSVGTELDRLPNETAVWQAVARRASEAASPATPPALGPDAASLVSAVLAGGTSVAEIPVEPVLDPVRNPEGLDLLEPDMAATRLLMARVLPGAVSPASDGIRVRLLNPLGDPSLTYDAVGRLIYVGAHVIIASEVAGPAPEESVIEFEAPDGEVDATRYAPIVGGATVRPADIDIDGVDATITLGESFRRFMAEERARSTATSPTSTTTTPSTSEP